MGSDFTRLWDEATLNQMAFNAALSIFIKPLPYIELMMWRGSIPKRKWRRWRGRVKAGKPIPAFMIDFDSPPRWGLPLPFVNTSLYQKD